MTRINDGTTPQSTTQSMTAPAGSTSSGPGGELDGPTPTLPGSGATSADGTDTAIVPPVESPAPSKPGPTSDTQDRLTCAQDNFDDGHIIVGADWINLDQLARARYKGPGAGLTLVTTCGEIDTGHIDGDVLGAILGFPAARDAVQAKIDAETAPTPAV